MSGKIACAGNKGDKISSDCFVTLGLNESGALSIDIFCKVDTLLGGSIRELVNDVLSFFSIRNANLFIEGTCALPLVLAARLEAAIKRLVETDKEYLFPVINKFC